MNKELLYDLSHLEEMLGGDKEAKLQMVNIFLKSTPETLSALNESYEAGNLEGTAKMAHKLKASIDIFDISFLKADIRELITLAREERDKERIDDLMTRVNDILGKAIDQVADYRIELEQEVS